MKKIKTAKLFSIVLLIALIVNCLSVFGGLEFAYADSGDYYSSITASGGTALLGQLHDLITTTHKRYTSYNDCKDPSIIKVTDPAPNGMVNEFYTQDPINSSWGGGKVGTWNREHVWCQSLSGGLWGTSGGGSDLHHIRPSESALNSTRGNNKFGIVEGGKPATNKDSGNVGGYVASNVFEPLDEVKGDVARIVMYVYTHYNNYSNVGGTTNGSGSASFGTLTFTMVCSARNESAAIRMLLDWNKMDPVDDLERTRNEEVFKIQGNRNPFIDDETYADRIWAGSAVEVELKGITVTPDELEIPVGQSKKLTAKATPIDADGRVNWSSSNESVATVSSAGIVTAKSEGTCVITATSIKNPSYSDMAIINVVKSGGGGSQTGDSSYIVIDKTSVEMTNGYGFKNWSSGGIGGMAFIYGGNDTYPATGLQFNIGQASYYIASNVALPGAIRSVTVKMVDAKEERPWKLLTSTTPYGEVAKKPTDGNDHGTKTVTSEGVTWEVSGNDTYFALTYELNATKGASYIDSITIEYASGSTPDPEPTPVSIDCTPKTVDIPVGSSEEMLRDLLTVEMAMSDNSTVEVLDYDIIGFDSSVAKSSSVTIQADGLRTTITVNVNRVGDIPSPVSIEVNPKSVTLEQSEANLTALKSKLTVTITYDDASVIKVDDYKIVGIDFSKEGVQTVTVSFDELSAQIGVTVKGKQEESTAKQGFIDAVNVIDQATTMNSKFQAIKTAISKYKELSSADKQDEQVAQSYTKLQSAIDAYNASASAINQTSQTATENAMKGAAAFMSYTMAILYILKNLL